MIFFLYFIFKSIIFNHETKQRIYVFMYMYYLVIWSKFKEIKPVLNF